MKKMLYFKKKFLIKNLFLSEYSKYLGIFMCIENPNNLFPN